MTRPLDEENENVVTETIHDASQKTQLRARKLAELHRLLSQLHRTGDFEGAAGVRASIDRLEARAA